MPNFELTGSIVKETVRTDGIQATCEFAISLKNVDSVRVTAKKGTRKLTASVLIITSDKVSDWKCMIEVQLNMHWQQWVDYKRIKVANIQKEQSGSGLTIRKSVVLTKPSQKIECYISCDEIGKLRLGRCA